MASWVRPRRIAIFGALSAAVLGVSAIGVATVTSLTGASHEAAASVAASRPLPPAASDVLSDEAARARDRSLKQAENEALRARLAKGASTEIPTEQISEPPADAPVLPGFVGRDLDCPQLKCVALTFDDGPGSETDRLLG